MSYNFCPLSPELLGKKHVGTGVGLMNMTAYFQPLCSGFQRYH